MLHAGRAGIQLQPEGHETWTLYGTQGQKIHVFTPRKSERNSLNELSVEERREAIARLTKPHIVIEIDDLVLLI